MAAPDMDVIKEIPGYKVILKAVLKSQIQQLVEQLACHTEEETVILTASVSDGTLSHLGSDSGKFFLEDHDDIKSQFLGFCLKRHHKKKQEEEQMKNQLKTTFSPESFRGAQRLPYQRSPTGFGSKRTYRQHPYTAPQQKKLSVNYEQSGTEASNAPLPISNATIVKVEPSENLSNPEGGPTLNDSSFSLNNSSNTLSPQDTSMREPNQRKHTSSEFDLTNMSAETLGNQADIQTDNGQRTTIKIEHISESDLELEITGVEPGQSGSSQDNWDPNSQTMDQSGVASGFENKSASRSKEQGSRSPRQQIIRKRGTEDIWSQLSQFDIQQLNIATCTKLQSKTVDPSPEKSNGLECSQCGKAFTSKSNLSRHIANHAGVKNLKCSYCAYRTNRTDHLKLHIWTKHYSQVSQE